MGLVSGLRGYLKESTDNTSRELLDESRDEPDTYPRDAGVLKNEFKSLANKATEFETVRWIVWLYDSIEEQEWSNVKYRTWVLVRQSKLDHTSITERDVTRLSWKIDEYWGEWLNE